MQTITTFRNPFADPMETRRGPPLVRGPQFENRCRRLSYRIVCSVVCLCVCLLVTSVSLHKKRLNPSICRLAWTRKAQGTIMLVLDGARISY